MAEYKFTMKNKNGQDQYDTLYPKICLANILDYEPSGAQFIVYCTTGTVARITNGSETLSATSEDGVAKIAGVGYGTWTVTAGSNTATVEVNELKQYEVFRTLNSYSWDEISNASANGTAANLFSVGDTKSIVLNGTVGNTTFNNVKIDAYILGINHNAGVEGNNRIHFCIGKVDGKTVGLADSKYSNYPITSSGYFSMSYGDSDNNTGGWNGCYMRSTIMPAIKNVLPTDLQNVLKTVTKYTDNVGGGNSNNESNVTATTETICLEAEFEVHGIRRYANEYEQNKQLQYDYYKNGNSKVRYKYNDTGNVAFWWNRSQHFTNFNYFCIVSTDGTTNFSYARFCGATAPCFYV